MGTQRAKRALLLTSNYPRWDGDSTTPFVAHLAHDLGEAGWQVDVLAPHAPGAARRETLNGVEVRRFRYLFPESQQTVCYGGGTLINLRKHRSNWLKLPFLVGSEFFVTLWLLMTRRYRLINAHWIVPQGFVGAVAGMLTRTPLIVTVHGGDVFDLRGRLLRMVKRWSLRRAAAITVNSTATREATAALAPAGNIHTLPMGITTKPPTQEAVAELVAEHRREWGPLVAFVGRLVTEKGVDDLIRAVARVRADLSHVTLVVAGTGQDRNDLEELTRTVGIDDQVTFTGWIQPEEVATYMAAADIFVGPSKQSASGWREGLGLVFLEAMAAGTPVVATRSGGIPDIVRHEETGLLVDENSPEQIADAIIRLHNDRELSERLVAAGSALVDKSYTRRASASGFAALFDSVAGTTEQRAAGA
jgi:glycosyltransferase involved in cell wall biosynthesis